MSKQKIDMEEALLVIGSRDFDAIRMNFYQIRIRVPDSNVSYDWYWSGSTVRNDPDRSPARVSRDFLSADELLNYILEREHIL